MWAENFKVDFKPASAEIDREQVNIKNFIQKYFIKQLI